MMIVKCVRDESSSQMLEDGRLYEVAVHITAGKDYKDRPVSNGYILKPFVSAKTQKEVNFPHVWDADRFTNV